MKRGRPRTGRKPVNYEAKIRGYLQRHFRLAWRYFSEKRKECLKAPCCKICKAVFTPESGAEADHIAPVVDPLRGFEGWDVYYRRMFDGDLRPLCRTCHKSVTDEQKAVRAKKRREDKAREQL